MHHFTFILLIGAAVSLLLLLIVAPENRRAAWFDVALAAMGGALLLGRALHVVIHWSYFRVNDDEILNWWAGGISWQGALLGAMLAAILMARFRRVSIAHWLDVAAVTLPMMGLASWLACWASLCAYGAALPLDAIAPPFIVHDAMDVYGFMDLRYATQPLGALSILPIIALMGGLLLMGRARGQRLGIALFWVALQVFIIGFWRGDNIPIWTLFNTTLRLDQWLDVLLMILAIALFMRPRSAMPPE